MVRLACISVPRLPLQIAQARETELSGLEYPLAIVREDRPTSPLLHVNRRAAELGLRTGLRYSEALALVCDLRAVTVPPAEIQSAQQALLEVLARWSPVVELCPHDAGSFWVAASGLSSLFGSEAQWGAGVRAAVKGLGYRAVVVVGFTRGATLVLARSRRRSAVLGSPEAEQRALAQAPLSEVPLEPRHRRLLERLGVHRFGQLAALSSDELARRFGVALVRELQAFRTLTLPLQPSGLEVAAPLIRQLEAPVTDRALLLPVVHELLDPVLDRLRRQGRLLAELRLEFGLELWASSLTPARLVEVLRPAAPTSEAKVWHRLVSLRLSQGEFPAAVTEVGLGYEEVGPPPGSGELFALPPTRDARRGAEALALIRAQWGNASVVHSVLLDSHVPEQAFCWEETTEVPTPSPLVRGELGVSVRRVFRQAAPRRAPGAGLRLGGPFVLKQASGTDGGRDQEYWFLLTARREVQWVSYDRRTQQSVLNGVVD